MLTDCKDPLKSNSSETHTRQATIKLTIRITRALKARSTQCLLERVMTPAEPTGEKSKTGLKLSHKKQNQERAVNSTRLQPRASLSKSKPNRQLNTHLSWPSPWSTPYRV